MSNEEITFETMQCKGQIDNKEMQQHTTEANMYLFKLIVMTKSEF